MAEKIYLVDDEESVLDVLSSFIKKDGFDIETWESN